MTIAGYYYLHSNGDLIWKRNLDDGQVADFRESSFVIQFWPLDPQDRETCWRILVEASALGAKEHRLNELADKWGCDDADAQVYAHRIGVDLKRDGNAWCAMQMGATNIQEFAAGFSEQSALRAMAELCKELGYRAQKMWGPSFEQLVSGRVPA
jgi:hypothetical protein